MTAADDKNPACPSCGTREWLRWNSSERSGKCKNKHMVMSRPDTGQLYDPNSSSGASPWTVRSSSSDVLDALSIWLKDHSGWRYQLEHRDDYLEKKWHARLVQGQPIFCGGDGGVSVNGRGDTAHEATVEMFVLANVPHPYRDLDAEEILGKEETLRQRPDVSEGDDPPRTSILDRNLNPAGPDRFA